MKLELEKNFNFNKVKIDQISSAWMNTLVNHLNKSIQDGLKKGVDINEKTFRSVSSFTKDSIQDNTSHKRVLNRSGRMSETRILRPTRKKLKFQINSGVKKSKKRWSVEYDGAKSSGTRKKSKVNYGKLHNEGFWTSKKSLIKKNIYTKLSKQSDEYKNRTKRMVWNT